MSRALVALCTCALLLGVSHVTVQPAVVQAQTQVADKIVGPVHTSGATLIDATGREVRITGVNWFGLETNTFAPHGLWARNYADMLDQIAAAGDLRGLNCAQILDRVIAAAG